MDLGRLEKINDLRMIWKNEASDFTTWLSKEKNIEELSKELGINIIVDEIEAPTGRYNLDIKAHEEGTDKVVIIENQIEVTDHDHLGKVIVYSAGFDAKIQIWIVKDVRDEHKQAVEWLNEHTDESINIFLVKIELWKIGDSKIAPKFQIIVQPNDWTKVMRRTGGGNDKKIGNAALIQLNFWELFREYCEKEGTIFRLTKATAQSWYTFAIGNSQMHISSNYNTMKEEVFCELYISNNKELYKKFHDKKEEIEEIVQEKMEWLYLEDRKASRIKVLCPHKVDKDNMNHVFAWLKKNCEILKLIHDKYI